MPSIDFMGLILNVTDHLVEVMAIVLCVALTFRLLASRASRRDQIYFKSFARAVEKTLEADDAANAEIENVDEWLGEMLAKVSASLPTRSLRYKKDAGANAAPNNFRFREKETLADFAEGKRSVIHAIKLHLDVLKSPFPPNFNELADRILDQDRQWRTVGGVPIATLARIFDILPGLFVVGGILGTFVGIATGLPKIGAIDMNKIAESSPVLSAFIENIALSMRCSISGIIYNIAMTLLNATFPIHAQRADVEKSVSRCMEVIWHRIHGNKPSIADSQIIDLLERIAGLLRGTNTGTQDTHIKVA